MDPEVQEILPKLVTAVEAVMNPATARQERREAYKACEDFKENSAHCVQCGLLMCAKEQPAIIRHFGLQLLEHTIKYKWNNMSDDDKAFIRQNALTLLASGTQHILVEQAHVKDAVSRIVVEIIKRQWPQQWPTLFQELSDLSKVGETQMELVLLTLLRLAEDVVAFQNVPSQRRRDILQTLTQNMTELFTFFVTTLKESSEKYQQLRTVTTEDSKEHAEAHCKVARTALETLCGYVDWVAMTHIIENDGALLQLLCLLLSDDQLQLYSADCLLLITSRKGKLEDRKPLLILFSADAMSTILNAAVTASRASIEEYHYLFLKRLCQVLIAIGSQLCALWGSAEDIDLPPHFDKYLEAILAFTYHPSQMLGSFTQALWASFLRHEDISEEEMFVDFVPRIIEGTRSTLLKIGFPSQDTMPVCGYTRLDFDSDQEFNVFFSKYRAEVAETIRLSTLVCPIVTFQYGARWLLDQLAKPVDTADAGFCNLSTPVFLEWDALTVYLESVMSRVMVSEKPKPAVEEGIHLLKAVLSYDTQDPLILSCVLSCISALFPYVTHAPDTLPVVLDKLFSSAVFNVQGQTKATRSKAVKNVRRHACSILVKICKQYPALLLPGFEHLYSHIQQISRDPEQLSQMEKGTLMEALILISNQFKSFEKQSAFIQEILAPVKEIWLSSDIKQALWYPDKFMTYVGLDQAPVEPSSADTCGINRSHIVYCINFILAVMKRTKWPEDPEEARIGGFVKSSTDVNNVILQNPATSHIITLLDNVLALTRTLNALWLDSNKKLRHPEFSKAYDLQEVDKLAILGIQPPSVDNTDAPTCRQPLARMQSFLTTNHDNCYHILGNAGLCLGHDFYEAPQLATSLLSSVFTNLDHIPDYRMRPIIQGVHEAVCTDLSQGIPHLCHTCPYFKFCVHTCCQAESDDNPESQEVLDDQLTRQLTREYVELLGTLCIAKQRTTESTDEMCVDEGDAITTAPTQHSKEDTLSELGQLVLKDEDVYSAIVLCVFNGLTWSDTSTCNKCIGLCWPMLKQMLADKKLMSEDACHLFTTILLGLQQHGQHEGCQAMLLSLGIQTYEHLRPIFPEVTNILHQVPNVSVAAIKAFDDKLTTVSPQKPSEKKKKEAFKKIVMDIIGKSLGQRFKSDIHIKNLPPMYRHTRSKQKCLEDQGATDIGLCALFMPDSGHIS